MGLNYDEKVEISKLPPVKRHLGCPIQQAEKDRKLKLAFVREFGDAALAEKAMRVVRECRG